MKHTPKTLITLFGVLFSFTLSAQEDVSKLTKGDVTGDISSSYNTKLVGQQVENVGFEVKDVLFGYKTDVYDNFIAEVEFEVDHVLQGENAMYIRKAYGKYSVDVTDYYFGIIDLNHSTPQQLAWNKRYVYETFQKEYGLSMGQDIGVKVNHEFSKQLSVDACVSNSEGYQNLQSDLDFLYGAGITVTPTQEFLFRLYGDFSNLPNKPVSLSTFFSVTPHKGMTLNAEYFYRKNNRGFDNQNISGLSLFTDYEVNSRVTVYGRFDKIWSNVPEGYISPWNSEQDGNAALWGIEFEFTRNFQMALNYKAWIFDDQNFDNESVIGSYVRILF